TARRQHDIARRLGIAFRGEVSLADADLIVDGLLGYSTQGAPRGTVERLIDAANESARPILAVDLPSGLDPDTGRPLATAIRATCTLTLALPKTGLLAPESRPYVGELVVADIGIPPAAYRAAAVDTNALFAHGDLIRLAS